MKTITINKLDISEVEAMRDHLNDYITYKNASLDRKDFGKYANNLLLIDVAQKMYYSFRGKVEKASKNLVNFKLSISESVILLDCCVNCLAYKNDFEKFTIEKIKNILHKEIINL